MPHAPATVFVCTTCRSPIKGENGGEDRFDEPGGALLERLEELTKNDAEIAIQPVECLAVCTRPCTVSLVAENKWTYIVGDIDTDTHAEDVAAMARAYAASENGIVPWRERPKVFRKGVVARVPPVSEVNTARNKSTSTDQRNLEESKTA